MKSEIEKKKFLDISEISLALDVYDDVFSDFDPRPYNQRAISEDMLTELKRASRDKVSGKIEIRFMIPKRLRNLNDEALIKKRLHDHFRRHHGLIHKEKNKVLFQGFGFLIVSIVVMLLTALFFFEDIGTDMISRFLFIMLEPAGWFLFWEGLDLVIFESKKINPELSFYEKMIKSEISFIEY